MTHSIISIISHEIPICQLIPIFHWTDKTNDKRSRPTTIAMTKAMIDVSCGFKTEPAHQKRRLSPVMASETTLTNATLLYHIISFQDGLPGLLCELKRVTQTTSGYKPELADLVLTAAKQRSIRALEMIDTLARTRMDGTDTEYFNDRFSTAYSRAAFEACERGDSATLWWIFHCPTIEHRVKRRDIKEMWSTAVDSFQPGNLSILEMLATYFTPAQVAKLDPEIWELICEVEALKWLTERYEFKLSTNLLWNAVQDYSDEFVVYLLENRPEQLKTGMLAHVLPRVDPDLFLRVYLKREHDDEERLDLIEVAVWEEDITKLKLLYSDQERYPFAEAPLTALKLAAERGLMEIVEELCSRHEGIDRESAMEAATANGHTRVVEFLSSRTASTGKCEAA